MAQETDLWRKETNLEREKTNERDPQKAGSGRNLPSGDGDVGDEQVNRIGRQNDDRPTGQDHSTDSSGDREPRDGVGAVQDAAIAGQDIADLPPQ